MTDFKSVPDMFLRRVEATPDAVAFLYPEGSGWKELTWRATEERVRAIACGLLALGLSPEEPCAILSSTRIEWILAALGILCAGGATTTIYPANTADECAYILKDCQAKVVFVEDEAQLAKVDGKRSELPDLKYVVVFDSKGGGRAGVLSLADLEADGREHDAANKDAFVTAAAVPEGSHPAARIYTSGTPGDPNGAG